MTRHIDPMLSAPRRDRALRRLLETQRNRIINATRSRIREVQAEGGAEADDVLDDAESSEADIQTDLELALLEMQRETLARIDAAIAELDEGTYGYCVSCGDDIATARLQALPFAIRCRTCEAAQEAAARHRSPAWHGATPLNTAA